MAYRGGSGIDNGHCPTLSNFGSHYWGTHHSEGQACRDGPAWLRVFLVYLAQTRSWFPLPFSRYHCRSLLRTHHPSHHYHRHYCYCLLPHHTPSSVCLPFDSLSLFLPSHLSRSPAFRSAVSSDRALNLTIARCMSTHPIFACCQLALTCPRDCLAD
ncbi:hypothetical protein F4823DRAFT_351374 [Ustulina deusta]|nr:hypothetical protein F4823DRAFT_351374 [Ustulina deusta]